MLEAASVGLSGSLHVHNNVLVGQLLQMQPAEGLPGACCLPVYLRVSSKPGPGVFSLGGRPVRRATVLGVVVDVEVNSKHKYTRFAGEGARHCYRQVADAS